MDFSLYWGVSVKGLPMASPAFAYARQNQQRFLNELKDLLRIPSVSTAPEHKSDVQRAADYVASELRRIGMENVEVIPTKGHPLIYADWLHAAGKPTLVCYTELFAPDLPTLCVGLRGLVYTEIEAVGPKVDLHSGMYGGAAPNPFFALIEIISKLKDSKGKVLVPRFYKNVKAPSAAELKAWKRLPFNEEHYRKTEVGSSKLTGEPGYSILYRTWARPTLEVHGMLGGFTAPGAKTVIPARAQAKVSMRLVPNQDPDDILKRYTAHVKKLTPKGIETKIKVWSKGPACVVGTDNQYIKAATESLREVFNKETVFIRSGGSIPIVTDFQDVLKIPSVMMGFGLPDDNLHAPNEKVHIPNFHRGIESICLFFEKLGK